MVGQVCGSIMQVPVFNAFLTCSLCCPTWAQLQKPPPSNAEIFLLKSALMTSTQLIPPLLALWRQPFKTGQGDCISHNHTSNNKAHHYP